MFIIFGTLAVVDCGNVPNVTNAIATLVDGDTQYGATVQYNCSIGYRPIGNSIITCPLNGSWPTPLPCTLVECGDPGIPVNGHSMGNNFTYGSTVTFTCDIGYELQGNKTALCQADGQWNATIPTCVIVTCGDPGTINNGHKHGLNFTYGSHLTFSCDEGYVISSNITLECLSNGEWDYPLPLCTIVTCGDPGIPPNGFTNGNNFKFHDVLTFGCDSDFSLIGNSNITCQANGRWSGNIPICLYIDCLDPCDTTTTSSDEPNNKETNNKGMMIGVTVGVSLFFVVLIIIIIILVSLFVWRSHHRTGKATVNSKNNGKQISVITNPLRKCLVNISLKLRYFNIIIIFAWYPFIYSEYVLIMLSYKLF